MTKKTMKNPGPGGDGLGLRMWPKPWVVNGLEITAPADPAHPELRRVVIGRVDMTWPKEAGYGTARLMAAAPELLAALEEALYIPDSNWQHAALAAIEKATGRKTNDGPRKCYKIRWIGDRVDESLRYVEWMTFPDREMAWAHVDTLWSNWPNAAPFPCCQVVEDTEIRPIHGEQAEIQSDGKNGENR